MLLAFKAGSVIGLRQGHAQPSGEILDVQSGEGRRIVYVTLTKTQTLDRRQFFHGLKQRAYAHCMLLPPGRRQRRDGSDRSPSCIILARPFRSLVDSCRPPPSLREVRVLCREEILHLPNKMQRAGKTHPSAAPLESGATRRPPHRRSRLAGAIARRAGRSSTTTCSQSTTQPERMA